MTADHKRRQAEFFDREPPEFEIERPHGTPALHRWLLEEKLRRGIAGLEDVVADGTALTVCGGSGMDAELLALAGARVTSSDISPGAVERVRERARRHGIEIEADVADVEELPYPDGSFDLVYVHDGLHHLEHPERGLAEMARVARRAVSVNEPARATATALAVRAGVAEEEEEAGNRVARLTLDEVADALAAAGMRVIGAERYAMFYRHHPGLPTRALSAPGLLPLARGGWRGANALLGRFGNKLSVRALRD